MNELRTCPFCGKPVQLSKSSDGTTWGFFHADKPINTDDTCPVAMGVFIHHVTMEEAIEVWNRRADDEGELQQGQGDGI